jgi:hypothetical protein
MSQSTTTRTRPTGPRNTEQEIRERALEIGLEDTFPASDPVAVIEPGPATVPPGDEETHAV